MTAVAVLTGMVVLLGATVWLYERRIERSTVSAAKVIGKLSADLERARGENTALLRQIAGIDPTPEQIRADMLEQLGQTSIPAPPGAYLAPNQPGPLPPTPSRWEFPPEEFTDDPTDLTAPLDQLPPGWDGAGIEAPGLAWGMDEPLAAPEPVPEGEHRPRIVGMGVDENPLEELGIEPGWRTE